MSGLRRRGGLGVAVVAILGSAAVAVAAETPADSTAPGTLLQRLQERDTSYFSDELFETDPGLRDSSLFALDSLGLEEFRARSHARRPAFDLSVPPAFDLIDYNRAEALVIGLGLNVETRDRWILDLEGAYATGSEKLRHFERLRVPVGPVELEGGYADRVVPYGSNRPTGNGFRALIGSADERDYLRRETFWGGLAADTRGGRFAAEFRGAEESSVPVETTFGVLGNSRLMAFNAPIDAGTERAVILSWQRGSLAERRAEAGVRHRIAGGGLGGDFTYTRTDLQASVRRYLPGAFEVVLDAAAVRTGGAPPVQQLADVGGLSTVRGFDRRSRVGESSLAVRGEVYLPYDPLAAIGLRRARLQFVLWGDAARVWDGDREDWLTALGGGVQRYLGPFGSGAYLRFDVALPTGPERPGDVRFVLRFARGLF